MFLSDKPATGWGRLVRIVLLACATVMLAVAIGRIEEGTGGFTSPCHRRMATAVILLSGLTAITVAIAAWRKSPPTG